MSNENETLADIVADIRCRADCAERHGDRETHNDGVAMLLRSIADRLEAALKREKAEIEAEVLTAGGIVEAARHKPGNAAAMREALEKCMELGKKIDESLGNDESTVWNCRYERSFANSIVEIAKAALSAPARNCDRFADAESARQAWLDDADNWDEFGSPELELYEWLLAPAAERKGEGK